MGIDSRVIYTCDSCGVEERGEDSRLSVSGRWYKRLLVTFDRYIGDMAYRLSSQHLLLCANCAENFDNAVTDMNVVKGIVEHGKQHSRASESVRDESSSSRTED